MTRSSPPNAPARRMPLRKLKCCPLCGSVNARANRECFVCGWKGTFDEDPTTIERGLADLIERCPDLADILLAPPPRSTWLGRLFGWLAPRRHIDLRY